MKTPFVKWIAWYLVLAMLVIGITLRVYAGFSPSEGMRLSPVDQSSDLQKIQKFLETKMVRERFKEFGLTQDDIQTRLSQLSEQQIHELAVKIEDLRVGGELGLIIFLLVVAIVVILILQLTGHSVIVR